MSAWACVEIFPGDIVEGCPNQECMFVGMGGIHDNFPHLQGMTDAKCTCFPKGWKPFLIRRKGEDKGPWTVEVEDDNPCLQSDDFKHDVRFYLSGDFKDFEDKKAYADELAALLNGVKRK